MKNDPENSPGESGREEPNGDETNETTGSPVATGQINVSDVLGLGKASENLKPVARSVANAFNEFFSPAIKYLDQRAEGAAHRHEVKADAKALQKLQNELTDDPTTLELVKSRFLMTEIRRQKNIQEATLLAIQHAEADSPDDAAQAIDEDFMADWVDAVKDVSNQDVRELWASILAEAPKSQDGRVPKPILDLLRQFDHSVAQSFGDFVKLVVYGGLPSIFCGESWEKIGPRVEFSLLKDIGAIERRDGPKLHLFGSWTVNQSGELIDSHLGLSAVPTVSVWAFRHRALKLARILFSDVGLKDEAFGYQVLKTNLQSLADDVHQYLQISIKIRP
jgi:hypothetical protein